MNFLYFMIVVSILGVVVPVTSLAAESTIISVRHVEMEHPLETRELADSSLKASVYLILNKICQKRHKGEIEEDSINIVVSEYVETVRKTDQHKLFARVASGNCRY